MENRVNWEQNRIFHLEASMLMYGIYYSDTLEQLIDTVHKMHNKTTWMKNYLLVNLIVGIIGIKPRMELATMP